MTGVPGIRLKAFAKVNLALEVRGLREDDGYHEVATVMQSVSLADEVQIEPAEGGFGLRVEPEGTDVGPPEKNTVYAAWKSLCEFAGGDLPVRVTLRKEIPAGAGLGGGSADAAAVLVGLNELFDLGLKSDELGVLGARIGADVPFCVSGGTALGEGIGDRLTPLPAPPDHRLVIVKPPQGADTAEIYRAHDEHPARSKASVEPVTGALRSGDLAALGGAVGNDLTPVTAGFVPEVTQYERALLESGALGAAMSGTGTAVYGVFGSEEGARSAVSGLQTSFAGIFEPVGRGIEVLGG